MYACMDGRLEIAYAAAFTGMCLKYYAFADTKKITDKVYDLSV